ncbi:MAG: tetratricopeptide repeat protein [Planctomycetota bacterium]|jgi:tetratricopeptide (TPR) repeat protein
MGFASLARRAESALAEGRFRQAADLYGRILASDDRPVFKVKRGLALWEAGSRKEGLAEARAGAKELPETHPGRLFLALMLVEEERRDEAEPLIRGVQEADPSNPFARGLTALARLASGQPGECAKLLEDGVFGSSLFRAHLLVKVEEHLMEGQPAARWTEGYLEMVL